MTLLFYCRPGFENDLAAEIAGRLPTGFSKAKENTGFVTFEGEYKDSDLNTSSWIFARQVTSQANLFKGLPETDRISTLLPYITETILNNQFSLFDVVAETPDTNEAKELSAFCKSFANAMRSALKKSGRKLQETTALHLLHIFFLDAQTCYVSFSNKNQSSPWPMGIPRLKFPSDAPSRSTLKLEEAFMVLMSEQERKEFLQSGIRAVDLGAAPGGWTFQFVKRNIHVTAIDNANLDKKLMESGMVTHLKENGLKWEPQTAVNWLVCDMVERPQMIAQVLLRWLDKNLFQHAVFNFKLPMKKRFQEVKAILDEIESHGAEVRCKQLYHDREEVTAYIKVL